MEYLGFELGHGWWKPSSKKTEALMNYEVKDLKTLRSFLGAMHFYRRHIKNFSYSSSVLTDLTKKEAVWHWGSVEAEAFAELKRKLTDSLALGVPKPEGEIILITDSSLIGGGASIYQWQSVSSDVMVEYHKFSTEGVFADGKMKHDYPETFRLVPLGHFNWKWNECRSRYSVYELELLSGILALSSQKRIIGHSPVVWLCDQQAASFFCVRTDTRDATVAPMVDIFVADAIEDISHSRCPQLNV